MKTRWRTRRATCHFTVALPDQPPELLDVGYDVISNRFRVKMNVKAPNSERKSNCIQSEMLGARMRARRAPGNERGVMTVAPIATKPQCPRANCGEELIFSYNVGNKGRLYPIYWCVADGNHYVRVNGELVPLIPVLSGRRKASMERTGEG